MSVNDSSNGTNLHLETMRSTLEDALPSGILPAVVPGSQLDHYLQRNPADPRSDDKHRVVPGAD